MIEQLINDGEDKLKVLYIYWKSKDVWFLFTLSKRYIKKKERIIFIRWKLNMYKKNASVNVEY